MARAENKETVSKSEKSLRVHEKAQRVGYSRALAAAISAGAREVAEDLLASRWAKGCDPRWLLGSVEASASKGDLELLGKILSLSEAWGKASKNSTALHEAAKSGKRACLDMLLAAGFFVDAVGEIDAYDKETFERCSPLMVAVGRGRVAMAKALIAAGADLELKGGRHGESALQKAIYCGRNSAALVKALAKAGADFESKDGWGSTVLMSAIAFSESETFGLEVLDEVVKHGARLDAVDEDGDGVLHFAAVCENPQILAGLLAAGNGILDVDAKNSEGKTPLVRAVASRRDEGALLLLEAGADWGALSREMDTKAGSKGALAAAIEFAKYGGCAKSAAWLLAMKEAYVLEDAVAASNKPKSAKGARL